MLKAYVCIWSNKSAAEMVKFYKSVFKGTKVGKFAYWGKNPMGVKEGSVLTAHITVLGQKIMLLNGFVEMPFNESVSFVVPCKTQREIDNYWKNCPPMVASPFSVAGSSISLVSAGRFARFNSTSGIRPRTRRKKKP